MASGRAFASLTKGNSVKGLKKKHPGIERFEGKQESPGFHYFMTTNGRLGPTGSFMVGDHQKPESALKASSPNRKTKPCWYEVHHLTPRSGW